jgi:hypothetical protein
VRPGVTHVAGEGALVARQGVTVSGHFEFGIDQRKQIVPACIPRTRLLTRELFAEIIEDRRARPPIVLAVVQRQGSPEILFLGQFRSHSDAESAAQQFISDYLSRNRD